MAALTSRNMEFLHQESRDLYPLFQTPNKNLHAPSAPSQHDGSNDKNIHVASHNGRTVTRLDALSNPSLKPGNTDGAVDTMDLESQSPGLQKRRRVSTDKSLLLEQQAKERLRAQPRTKGPPMQGATTSNFAVEVVVEQDRDMKEAKIATESPRRRRRSCSGAFMDESTIQKTPKKILRYNPKTGTIGSPPVKSEKKSHQKVEDANSSNQISTRQERSKSRIVTVPYSCIAHDRSAFGSKIDQILANVSNSKHSSRRRQEAKLGDAPWWLAGKRRNGKDGKFKLSNADLKQDTAQNDTIAQNTVPVTARSRVVAKVFSKPATSAVPGFGIRNAKLFKHPGAAAPAWPWNGMLHIRDTDDIRDDQLRDLADADLQYVSVMSKKSKDTAVGIGHDEDVIVKFASKLKSEAVVNHMAEMKHERSTNSIECLRLPTRHFESGRMLQQLVRKELVADLPTPKVTCQDSSDGEMHRSSKGQPIPHFVLTQLYDSLLDSRSAFDQFECETHSWVHKYAPKCADEVLQAGREVRILKEWLQTLEVVSVESGLAERGESRSSSGSRQPAFHKENCRKRKRRPKKLEGFIVSSDEDEEDDMDEVTEPGDEPLVGLYGQARQSVIRSRDGFAKASKEQGRMANAIVVSGPSGCGKTAAVYAVAKDLGFEVFEINPGTRRSGKDVLEKVGDMTRNHLVQGTGQSVASDTSDSHRLREAVAQGLRNGHQKTMKSFFKATRTQKSKPKPNSVAASKNGKTVPPTPKQQKQSLILLEEVDTLYEDDKQFWTTIMILITQSKRPVVLTCNDETALPLTALSLHAIVRFSPPPLDLAVDYMLLVCANQGHVIKRDAVKALYEARNLDLRASIMELDFWCQFAVGDRRAGLHWLPPRWPPGCDRDEQGDVKRVISEGTYQKGMGWLSRDFIATRMHYLDVEEELLHEAWHGWNMDMGDWQECPNLARWADEVKTCSNAKAALAAYDDFAQSMSAADLCGGSPFASDENLVTLDTSLPDLIPEIRSDYPLAHSLLEASPLEPPHDSRRFISMYLKSRIRENFQIHNHIACRLPVSPVLDGPSERTIISLIRSHCSAPLPYTPITRQDLSWAFDPISCSPTSTLSITSSNTLEHSVFDRTIKIIAGEVAPYVRAVVRYDEKLRQDRVMLSCLMSEGGTGRPGKRMRTTRSAYSALEGGQRRTTRRERWFGEGVNVKLVEMTGAKNWSKAIENLAKQDDAAAFAEERAHQVQDTMASSEAEPQSPL